MLMLQNPVEGAYYSTIQESFEGWGHYHGVILGLQKRLSSGWSMNTNLTLSQCRNNGEPGTDITNVFPDPERPEHQLGAVRRRSPVHPQQLVHLPDARRRQRLLCTR